MLFQIFLWLHFLFWLCVVCTTSGSLVQAPAVQYSRTPVFQMPTGLSSSLKKTNSCLPSNETFHAGTLWWASWTNWRRPQDVPMLFKETPGTSKPEVQKYTGKKFSTRKLANKDILFSGKIIWWKHLGFLFFFLFWWIWSDLTP